MKKNKTKKVVVIKNLFNEYFVDFTEDNEPFFIDELSFSKKFKDYAKAKKYGLKKLAGLMPIIYEPIEIFT